MFTLIHEMSHAIAGILLGLKLKRIEIMPFGFKISFWQNRNKMKKILVTLAGPLVNLIIMTVAIIFKWNTNVVYANLIIAIFNLIPIYPLDGGRLLKTILSFKYDFKKKNKIVNKVANLTIIALTAITSIVILYIKNVAIIAALAYLWYIVIRENKKYNLMKRVYKTLDKPLEKQ